MKAAALLLALLIVGCINTSAGPSSVDVVNDGSQIVKIHVVFNATNGTTIEHQVYIVGPLNTDEKEVAATNDSDLLRVEAWTETGLHTPAPVDVRTNAMAVTVRVNDTAMTIEARGR